MESLRLSLLIVLLSIFDIDPTAGKLQIFSGGGVLVLNSSKCKKCLVVPVKFKKALDPDNINIKKNDDFIEAMKKKCETFPAITKSSEKLLDAFIKRTSKWCGNNGDKGVKSCCLERSKCTTKLKAGQSIGEVRNTNSFTLNGCHCEKKFRKCLRGVKNTESKKVYRYHFRVHGGSCVIYDHPLHCTDKTKKSKSVRICTRDKQKPKRWQIRKSGIKVIKQTSAERKVNR